MKHMQTIYYATITSLFLFTGNTHSNTITAEISFGELIDKITILTIKSERITNQEKLKNIHTELTSLQNTCDQYVGKRNDIAQLQALLKKINAELWDIEDAIRIKERKKEFDDEFIAIARSVYITNDQRFAVKKEIDTLLGSSITEQKSYEEFS